MWLHNQSLNAAAGRRQRRIPAIGIWRRAQLFAKSRAPRSLVNQVTELILMVGESGLRFSDVAKNMKVGIFTNT
jgi:hypothetical protein